MCVGGWVCVKRGTSHGTETQRGGDWRSCKATHTCSGSVFHHTESQLILLRQVSFFPTVRAGYMSTIGALRFSLHENQTHWNQGLEERGGGHGHWFFLFAKLINNQPTNSFDSTCVFLSLGQHHVRGGVEDQEEEWRRGKTQWRVLWRALQIV